MTLRKLSVPNDKEAGSMTQDLEPRWHRRGVLAGLSGLALTSGAHAQPAGVKFQVPDGACDTHFHIYDPRFAYQPDAVLKPPFATVDDYRKVQARTGLTRAVVVTPSTYGTDNACMLDAVRQLGTNARGIAVCHATVPIGELRRMHDAGVRGVRFQLGRGTLIAPDEILPLARLIAPLGWHMQFNMPVDDYARLDGILRQVPGRIVIDHFGRIPFPDPMKSDQYQRVRRLLDSGRCWLRLAAPYSDSRSPGPDYADVVPLAQDLIRRAPERMVWASNWPYVDVVDPTKPRPLDMLNLLAAWAPDAATRHRILVENPEALYGFDPKRRPKTLA